MFRYAFKEFQESCSQNSALQDQGQCNLDDSMFRCFIHWYTKQYQSIQDEKKMLQNLAKQFNAILCIWRVVTEEGQRFNMVDVKAIEDLQKLPQFLGQALEVSKATMVKKKFRVLSICIINKFGSFEAEKCYSKCDNCGEEQRLNECCAQFMCSKCYNGKELQTCPYCKKKLQVCPIPLQTVSQCQSKNIYQPMFPYLSLQERLDLMDLFESQHELI